MFKVCPLRGNGDKMHFILYHSIEMVSSTWTSSRQHIWVCVGSGRVVVVADVVVRFLLGAALKAIPPLEEEPRPIISF